MRRRAFAFVAAAGRTGGDTCFLGALMRHRRYHPGIFHYDSDEMILAKYTRVLEEFVGSDGQGTGVERRDEGVSSSVIGEIAEKAVRVHAVKPNSIYVQDAVDSMCAYYLGCDGDGRRGMFDSLAAASVREKKEKRDVGALDKAIASYQAAVHYTSSSSDDEKEEQKENVCTLRDAMVLQALEDVSVASVPLYEEVFDIFSKFRGLEFLIMLRADLNTIVANISRAEEKKQHVFGIMNENLKRNISKWFVDGKLLQLERLTWEHASAAVLERLVIHEKVHRMRSWMSLKQRFVGKHKRVFVWKHPALPGVPLLAVYISLEKSIPTKLPQIFRKASSPSRASPNVAVFYSINNMEDGLKGIDLGHSLITEAMRRLQEELPNQLDTFCTLSPIPLFSSWVYQNIEELANGIDDETWDGIIHSRDDGSNRPEVLSELLQSLQARHDEDAYERVRDIMLRWCAQYLTNTSSMDPVTRFHVENGAYIYQIHYEADLSANGRERSFGLMVTYMYQGGESVSNSYRRDGVIPVHQNVKQLLT